MLLKRLLANRHTLEDLQQFVTIYGYSELQKQDFEDCKRIHQSVAAELSEALEQISVQERTPEEIEFFLTEHGFQGYKDITMIGGHEYYIAFKCVGDNSFHYQYVSAKEGSLLPGSTDIGIKLDGKIVKYRTALPFSDGLAAVEVYEDQWWYIDETGKKVLGPYGKAQPFNSGLTLVHRVRTEAAYCIDKTGAKLKPFESPYFLSAPGFTEGRGIRRASVFSDEAKGCDFVDTSFNRTTFEDFEEVRPYSEGVAAVTKNGGDWYFIDLHGNPLFLFDGETFTEAGSFRDGLARVKKDGKYFFVNKAGDRIAEGYGSLGEFHCGRAWAMIPDTNEYVYLNNKGEEVSPRFERPVDAVLGFPRNFSDDRVVMYTNGESYVFDTDFQKVSKGYKHIEDYKDGRAKVKKSDGTHHFINRGGWNITPVEEKA